jgi:hypothetical protein
MPAIGLAGKSGLRDAYVEMVTCFIMAPMPHPFAIGVYVRSVRMSVVIPKVALLSRMILLVCRG